MASVAELSPRRPVAWPTVGCRVLVQDAFGRWAAGFEVAEEDLDGYRLRRLSDGWILPTAFDAEELLPDPD